MWKRYALINFPCLEGGQVEFLRSRRLDHVLFFVLPGTDLRPPVVIKLWTLSKENVFLTTQQIFSICLPHILFVFVIANDFKRVTL